MGYKWDSYLAHIVVSNFLKNAPGGEITRNQILFDGRVNTVFVSSS